MLNQRRRDVIAPIDDRATFPHIENSGMEAYRLPLGAKRIEDDSFADRISRGTNRFRNRCGEPERRSL